TDASSATSHGPAHARPPAAWTDASTSRAGASRVRNAMPIAAPLSASSSVMLRPMPLDPPVTTATRPARLRSSRDSVIRGHQTASRNADDSIAFHEAFRRPDVRDGAGGEAGADGGGGGVARVRG